MRFAIYNHKGGVGKTTLTVNVASAIAEQGKRVLLVDTDPQCNLTSYLLDDVVVDGLLDSSDGKNGKTIWTAIKPVAEGSGDVKIITPYELPERPGASRFLIPGDIRLSEFERELDGFWSLCLQRRPRGYTGTAAISTLVEEVVKKYNIDYVFYDSGPNIGPLNRAVLLDCDFFIVPVACDLFSLRALKTLGRTLRTWIKEWATIHDLAPEEAPLLLGQPVFLGYIPQQFKIYAGKVTKSHSRYLRQIDQDIRSQIIDILKELGENLALSVTGSKLGQVRDYGTIVTTSQREGVPISDVAEDPNQLGPEAHKTFARIAQKIIERAEAD